MHPRKRKDNSTSGSEQTAKRPCGGIVAAAAAAAVPGSAAAAREAHAHELMEETQWQTLQVLECIKLARLLSLADVRPLNNRAEDVFKLLQEDEARQRPLLNLAHKLAVSEYISEGTAG